MQQDTSSRSGIGRDFSVSAVSRLAACVEYGGTHFAGWQRQNHARSVQAEVESAISIVANRPVEVVCAGRTDSGVHAEGQVIHFETSARRDPRSWLLGANSNLPEDVVLRWVRVVPPEFHARFDARARHYRYVILNRDTRPALDRNRVAFVRRHLDAGAMREGAKALVGEHDFSAFRAAECQAKSPVRRVVLLTVRRLGDYIEIDVIANAFLHRMVRNLAGVLIAIGAGKRQPDWAGQVLRGRERRKGGATAPPGGLRLMGVFYPERPDLPLDHDSRALFESVNL
jgi:tRNA pseudouridine38-40 synthase